MGIDYGLTRVYHFSSMENLPGIFYHRALFCKSRAPVVRDVSNQEIQGVRAQKQVPYHGGVLHDYVPFYFNPRSPMLYGATNRGRNGQNFVMFQGTVNKVCPIGVYVFTDLNARMDYARFYRDLGDMAKLDWDAINRRYWREDGRGSRQAEFLIKAVVPLVLLDKILVGSDEAKRKVDELYLQYIGNPMGFPRVEVSREALFVA